MLAKNDIKVGLDIGSSQIHVIVSERDDDYNLHLIGVGTGPSAGLRRGVIVDMDSAAAAISDAVAHAEETSGCAAVSVLASASGAHISSLGSRGAVAIGRSDREITQEDVDRVLEAARVVAIPPDREVVHVLPREFVIDGCTGIRKPVGMTGIRLDVDANIITGSATAIQNIHRSARRIGLEVEQIILQPIAAAEAVLTSSEKEQGSLVIDMGGATTDIAVCIEGSVHHVASIPVGGSHVTNDIALVMRLPVGYSERLKLNYGSALPDAVGDDESCGTDTDISRKKLCQIIEARIHETMELVKEEVDRAGYSGQLPAGVVVTGGASVMQGVVSVAEEVLGLPARLGVPVGVYGAQEAMDNPAYATAVGLIKCVWGESAVIPAVGSEQRKSGGFASEVRQWFRDIFSS